MIIRKDIYVCQLIIPYKKTYSFITVINSYVLGRKKIVKRLDLIINYKKYNTMKK